MRIEIVFDSDEQKAKFASNVAELMQSPTTDVEVVIQAVLQQFMLTAKDLYVKGGVKRETEQRSKVLSSEADTLFGGTSDTEKAGVGDTGKSA